MLFKKLVIACSTLALLGCGGGSGSDGGDEPNSNEDLKKDLADAYVGTFAGICQPFPRSAYDLDGNPLNFIEYLEFKKSGFNSLRSKTTRAFFRETDVNCTGAAVDIYAYEDPLPSHTLLDKRYVAFPIYPPGSSSTYNIQYVLADRVIEHIRPIPTPAGVIPLSDSSYMYGNIRFMPGSTDIIGSNFQLEYKGGLRLEGDILYQSPKVGGVPTDTEGFISILLTYPLYVWHRVASAPAARH